MQIVPLSPAVPLSPRVSTVPRVSTEPRVPATPAPEDPESRSEAGRSPTTAGQDAAQDLALLRQITGLRQRDREVRAHEQAHQIAGGAHAGAPTYIYATGPDGRRYAIGGSVPIDVSPSSSPEATIAKMQQVRRAALAPQNPSAADRAIAARASLHLAEARREVMQDLLTQRYGAGERTAADMAPGSQISVEA